MRNASYDLTTVSMDEFFDILELSVATLSTTWGPQNLDLTEFRQSGNKLLSWHGLIDGLIPALGTAAFRDQVEQKLGGADEVDGFYRLFFAPGVAHCVGGDGPSPIDPLSQLIAWVENGTAPDIMPALIVHQDGEQVTRNLCRYPTKLVYLGGHVDLASSYGCG